MKFKAVVSNDVSAPMQSTVLHVLQALQRLERAAERRPQHKKDGASPSIILKMTSEAFAFCHRAGADEGSQTWSHFNVTRLFKEYRIESKRQGRIDLEVSLANLIHVFTSCQSSEQTTLRLSNGRNGRPAIGFEFLLSGNVADHTVQQEVPVRVITEAEAEDIREPALPEPEYQIELPRTLGKIQGVLDKMRKVGAQYVAVEAALEALQAPEQSGAPARAWLRLAAEAELVSVASTFSSLALVTEGKSESPPAGPVRLLLTLRRLLEVLSAFQQVNAEAHIACVLEGRALVLYALLPDGLGSLISYTPAVAT